jgi:hypothetical protein
MIQVKQLWRDQLQALPVAPQVFSTIGNHFYQ